MAQRFKTSLSIDDLSSAAAQALGVRVTGDSHNRLQIDAGGKVIWGGGASAGDANLYRSASATLTSDGIIQALSGLVTVNTDGTPTAEIPDGALAVDTTNNKFYFRSSSIWQEVSAGGGGASVTVSDTPPLEPAEGDLWFESDTGDIFVYYDSVWVDIGGSSVANIAMSDTAPENPTNGDFWFETDTARTFVYYNDGTSSQWVEVGATSTAAVGDEGYIQYYSGGSLAGASALYYDETNERVGIKTLTPTSELDVNGTITTDYVQFDTGLTGVTGLPGQLFFSQDEGTLEYGLTGGEVNLPIGAKNVIYVKNGTLSSIPKGSAVMATGAAGDRIEIAPAVADGSVDAKFMLGVTAEAIGPEELGYVATFGYIRNLDTSLYSVGTILYFDPNNPGLLTSTEPVAPDLDLPIAIVTRSQSSSGIIFVRMDPGTYLGELHGVALTTPTSGDFLKFNGTTWANEPIDLGADTVGNYIQSLSAGTGVTIYNGTGEGASAGIAIGQDVSTSASAVFDQVTGTYGVTTLTTSGTPTQEAPDGTLAVDTINNVLYVRSGGLWVESSGGASVTISDTPPAGANEGDLWYESDTGATYVYYDSFWVEIGASTTYADGAEGYVQYYSSGVIAGASAHYWDATNERLGIKNTSPQHEVDVTGTVRATNIIGTSGVTTFTTSGAPTGAADDGTIAVDTTNDTLYIRSNGTWVESSGGASVTVSDTAPTGAEEGDLWYKSDVGTTLVYYDNAWVEITGSGSSSAYKLTSSSRDAAILIMEIGP